MILKKEDVKKIKKNVTMATKQSIGRLTAKQATRTTVNRLITSTLGNGLIGALCKTLASQAIKQTDKIEYDKDFGVFYKKNTWWIKNLYLN